jgi:hypothetical protein
VLSYIIEEKSLLTAENNSGKAMSYEPVGYNLEVP